MREGATGLTFGYTLRFHAPPQGLSAPELLVRIKPVLFSFRDHTQVKALSRPGH